MTIFKLVKTSVVFFFLATITLGVIYPFFTYLIGSVFFHHKAQGSLVYDSKKRIIGSELIGQKFSSEKYFHPRPSRSDNPYDPMSPSNANYGPTNKKLYGLIEQDIKNYKQENSTGEQPLPIDAITASASGLDPDISLRNALLQVPRVAKSREISNEDVIKIIKELRKKRFLNILGQERVNVLKLNLALDEIKLKSSSIQTTPNN